MLKSIAYYWIQMKKPNRKPDYFAINCKFYFDEMLEINHHGAHQIIEKDNVIYRNEVILRSTSYVTHIQNAYQKWIHNKVEEILLSSETESK